MIKALDTATQGLLQAEKRATDIAKNILKSAGETTAFSIDEGKNTDAAPQGLAPQTAISGAGAPVQNPNAGTLIQQFADLRAEKQAFATNAKVFETVEDTLGSLINDEG